MGTGQSVQSKRAWDCQNMGTGQSKPWSDWGYWQHGLRVRVRDSDMASQLKAAADLLEVQEPP